MKCVITGLALIALTGCASTRIILAMKCVITGLALIALTGCASWGTEAWERQNLAKREMWLISEPIETATDDHIYFSKEASSGGQSFGGGGCGCN